MIIWNNSLTKQEKRRYNKTYFTNFLETYKPLRKYYRERIQINDKRVRNVLINHKEFQI